MSLSEQVEEGPLTVLIVWRLIMAEDVTRSMAPGGASDAGGPRESNYWRERTRVSLSPVAAPSILGLYGFAAATFMVSANLAGWFGTNSSQLIVFPLALFVGGLAQFMAAMWAYRARDGLATGIHGVWGSFWLAYGLYMLLVATTVLPAPSASPIAQVGFGYWFIVLAAITWAGMFAALAVNLALFTVLLTLGAATTLLAIGWVASLTPLVTIGALVLVACSVIAYYTATAMMVQSTFGKSILPVGSFQHRTATAESGSIPAQAMPYEVGEPGVKHGQ